MSNELIEQPGNFRYTTEPVEHQDLYNFYLRAQEAQWVPNEISNEMTKDYSGWLQLTDDVQHYIKHIVAFFAISDGVVGELIAEELNARITVREIKLWYTHQGMMEDVHSIVYSQLVNNYVKSHTERQQIFNSISQYPSIRRKISWLHSWIGKENVFRHLDEKTRDALRTTVQARRALEDLVTKLPNIERTSDLEFKKLAEQVDNSSPVPLAQVILANVIMEGVYFSGSFCSIFWIEVYYPGLLPGLTKANEWISRDEGMHTDYAILLYLRYIVNRLPVGLVHRMFREAVEIEGDFIREALPKPLKGMNSKLMIEYVEYTADRLLEDLQYPVLFGTECPFDFMIKQSIGVRIPDFFTDHSVSEYGLANNNGLSFDEDF